ncbi:MAG: FAD-dependent oxidoreductase [Lachnospiraceae bacterium]
MKELVIIGAGPAGLSAALYAARAGADFRILDTNYMGGGQVLTTYEVDNYLGMPGMGGFDMGMKFQAHVTDMGVALEQAQVDKIEKTQEGFRVDTSIGSIETKTVLLATGAENSKLKVDGEERLKGKGVSYCATCDGAFYREKTVAVVGGSYTAVEDAIYLANICKKVYVVHRRDKLRAGAVLEGKLFACENVEMVWNSEVKEILGDSKVSAIRIFDKAACEIEEIFVDGVFVAVGTTPSTDLVKDILELDEFGYVCAGETGETTQEGLYVAGDLRQKSLRQIVTAVADGANAFHAIWEYMKG